MAGRPPACDPVLRALRSGRGSRTRRRRRRGRATRCSRSRRSTATASRPTTRRVPAELLVAKPRALGHAESAAIPLPALSAWQGLFDHGRLGAGERVLIHGAAGASAGSRCSSPARRGAHVIGTASAANLDLVRELGAHEAVDAATRFEDAVEPVDVVFDTAGGERLRRSFAVLGAGGRLVSVAEEPPDGGVYFIVEPNRDQLTSIARLADAGELRPPVRRGLPARVSARGVRAQPRAGPAGQGRVGRRRHPSGRNMTAPRTTIAGIAIPTARSPVRRPSSSATPPRTSPGICPHEAGDVGGVVEDAAQGTRHAREHPRVGPRVGCGAPLASPSRVIVGTLMTGASAGGAPACRIARRRLEGP